MDAPLISKLTPQQLKIARRICDGKSSKEIAHELGLSVRTINVHRAHVYKRLGVHNVAQMVGLMLQHKIWIAPTLRGNHAHSKKTTHRSDSSIRST